MELIRTAKRAIDVTDEQFFAKLFEVNEVGQGQKDILAIATDAVNHFSGNALAQLILARTGQYFIDNLPKTTTKYRTQFIRGLEKVPIEELNARSEVAAVELLRIQAQATEGNWNNLLFLRELMTSCNTYTYVVYDYATYKKK